MKVGQAIVRLLFSKPTISKISNWIIVLTKILKTKEQKFLLFLGLSFGESPSSFVGFSSIILASSSLGFRLLSKTED